MLMTEECDETSDPHCAGVKRTGNDLMIEELDKASDTGHFHKVSDASDMLMMEEFDETSDTSLIIHFKCKTCFVFVRSAGKRCIVRMTDLRSNIKSQAKTIDTWLGSFTRKWFK